LIRRIDALNYRSLKHVSQPLSRFQILVGPNASGKSSFLDVPAFLGDVLRVGPSRAILGDKRVGLSQRAPDITHLFWMRQGVRFELAIELTIPPDRRGLLGNGGYSVCRYEVAVGLQDQAGAASLLAETLWLRPDSEPDDEAVPRSLFPQTTFPPAQIIHTKTPTGWRRVVNKVEESGNDYFSSETSGWNNLFRLGPSKSALANLPEDEAKFPIATWLKRMLLDGIQKIALNSEAMRRPSPPGESRLFAADGSNIPWVVASLMEESPKQFVRWIEHVQTVLPDLESISTRERPEDRHGYLVAKYRNGLEAPSWLTSDGTLRLLALTLLAYIPDIAGIYLIEEPENGVHPKAVEAVFQSLSSVYSAQVLCATHSPIILSMADADDVLCFAKNDDGSTDIVKGTEHPRLRQWKGETDLGTLFASGVLG
jgi:AAA domain, putative AbiEii toxin, Type IV TA system